MPHALLMCGLSFSGKSTVARRVSAALDLVLISLDAINDERGLRGGEGLPVAEWERTSHIAMARLEETLRAGRSAVVDDTFSHRFLRDRARAVAASCGAHATILYMDTPLAAIKQRREANRQAPVRHAVRDAVFDAHRDTFQHPGADEPVVRIGGDADIRAWLDTQKHGPGRP